MHSWEGAETRCRVSHESVEKEFMSPISAAESECKPSRLEKNPEDVEQV